jgi:hypothetical protein
MPNHPPVKIIQSFIGHCNFFWGHIKDFAIITMPWFELTRKDSGHKAEPFPKEAMDTFCIVKNPLTSEHVMAFPQGDWQYAPITDAATDTADTAERLGTILTAADVSGMGVFNEYLKGKKFILYTDHKLLEKMGHLRKKQLTASRLIFKNTTLSSNTKREPSCWLSNRQDSHPAIQMSSQLSIFSIPNFQIFIGKIFNNKF